jgi:hypothetical protein
MYPCNRSWRPIDLWKVEDPTFSGKSAHTWRWDCQSYALAELYHTEKFLYSLILEADSIPGPWCCYILIKKTICRVSVTVTFLIRSLPAYFISLNNLRSLNSVDVTQTESTIPSLFLTLVSIQDTHIPYSGVLSTSCKTCFYCFAIPVYSHVTRHRLFKVFSRDLILESY